MRDIFKNLKTLMTSPWIPGFIKKADLSVLLEGRKPKSEMNIYFHNNRYFLPLSEIVKELDGSLSFKEGKLYIRLRKREITANFNEGTFKAMLFNNTIYLTLSQIVLLLDLKVRWKYEEAEIELYFNRDSTEFDKYGESNANAHGTALIRFEDFTAGPPYCDADSLEKIRIMIDHLYHKGIPFHVAWIPKYMDPGNNIANDISRSFNIVNSDFLFTLDYIIEHGGIIGLHGYTHQHGREVSGEGTEFDDITNNDEKSVRKRLESAIDCAKKLEFESPCAFFESPHYAATEFQQNIMEEYFDYIYEPYVGIWGDEPILSPRNHRTIYVPTPLDYVSGIFGADKMILKILNLTEGKLGSLFYHPDKEFDFMQLSLKHGYPEFSYSEKSPLHRILNAFESKEYKPVSIKNINIP